MPAAAILRSTAASALSVVAAGLSAGASLAGRVAGVVRPEPGHYERRQQEPGQPESSRSEPVRHDGAGGGVRRAPADPVPEAPTHVRTHETHAEELAARTAAEVVAVVPDLSTDELGRLYEHEAANKKRKTVLAAIERAADPRRPGDGERVPGHEEPMPEAGGVPVGGGRA